MGNRDGRYVATPLLKTVLREQGRVDRWLGERIHVSKGHFSKILAGTRTVSLAQAEEVSSTLDKPLFLLFEVSSETNSIRKETVAT